MHQFTKLGVLDSRQDGGRRLEKFSFANPLLSQQYLFNQQSTLGPGSDSDAKNNKTNNVCK